MTNETKQPPIIWWALWGAFQIGILVIYFSLGSAQPASRSADSAIWVLGLVPVAISTIIRWLFLPLAQSVKVAFPLFIAGLAMAEATCILGLFIFPEQKLVLFLLSALGIFQFIPLFARRFWEAGGQ